MRAVVFGQHEGARLERAGEGEGLGGAQRERRPLRRARVLRLLARVAGRRARGPGGRQQRGCGHTTPGGHADAAWAAARIAHPATHHSCRSAAATLSRCRRRTG